MNQNTQQPKETQPANKENKKPNEMVGIHFSEKISIINPKSGEVVLQKRCD